ncbi:MAG: AbgT family transporter, partial [Gaiellales bacterium]
YETGRGALLMRARTAFEEHPKTGRKSIVATEIPYQVNKAELQKKIADLVHEKVLEGISDIRDESDRDGVRVVIELKKGEVPDVVLNNLFKHTQFQTTFGVITLAIVSGRPRVLPLVDLLDHFVEFRRDVVRRRIEFELKKAEARAHILEGLAIALDHLDAVIALIRASSSPILARDGLMTQFGLSQIQAQAILDMQLQRLTGLERQKIVDELAALKKEIDRLRTILSSRRLLMEIVVNELREIQEKFGDARRTAIVDDPGEIRIEDLIADEDMAITVSNTGYIKRTSLDSYSQQRRGGKGRRGMDLREEDFVSHIFVASTHAFIMIFSDRGRAYWLKVYEIPDVGPANRGKAIANLVSMEPGEKIAALLAVREFPEDEDQQFIVMGTRKGVVKKTDLKAFANPRAGGIIGMGVEEDDALLAVQQTDGKSEVLIGTRQGQSIRFPEEDVRSMGRTAYGVRGIALKEDDEVVAMEVVRPGGTVLTVTANGYGKRTALEEYRLQSRGGSGIINIQTSDRNGVVVGIAYVSDEHELMLITQQGQTLRMGAKDVRVIGRATQGVRLIGVAEGDQVVSIVRLEDQGDANGSEPNGNGGEGEPSTDTDATPAVTPEQESRGLRYALFGVLGFLVVVVLLTLPPGAPLRDPTTGDIIGLTPFMDSLLFIITLFFLLAGIGFGFGAGTFTSSNDVIAAVTKTFAGLAGLVFMLLMISQFIAYFNYSNMPTVAAVKMADFLEGADIGAVWLLIGFIIVTAILDLIIPGVLPKWAIFAPVFIPLFMRLGVAPQTVLAAYRVGDSPPNIVTPLMVYLPFIVVVAQRYRKDAGIGTIVSLMIPYTVIVLLLWTVFFVIWYLLGIPMGPGYPVKL